MSNAINFRFTQAGRAATFNVSNTGVSLTLTHIQLGSGNKTPAGTETALLLPKQTALFASGSTVNIGQIRMSAIFTGATNFSISEVGLWAGDPAAAGSVLVAYWAQSAGVLAYKSPGVDFVFSHDMLLNTDIPVGALTIQADHAQSPMLAIMGQHNALIDPHPQYETAAESTAKINAHTSAADPHPQYASDVDLVAHTSAADPHPQYETAAEAAAKFAAHESAGNPHPQYHFPSGTRMPFAQASAPTGWTQDTTDAANNRMLRVVSGAGNGTGGTHSPILNNVVPSHTHGFTTGNVSNDHAHYVSGGTSGAGAHTHSMTAFGYGNSSNWGSGGGNVSGTVTTASAGDHSHSWGGWTGGINSNHTHSGSTDNGSSQTSWQPRYIDMIICSKN